MPARDAVDLDEALQKKGGLTLSQLANYDDLITDALVDRVYFWSVIRKVKANFHASRGVQEEKVCDILRQNVIIDKNYSEAHDELLKLPGLARYRNALKTVDEQEHFDRHLHKYIKIYLPDCPFEVCTTNRYTIQTAEACVVARRKIKQGEAVKYLTGIQVEMTEKEEKELSSRTDFSIVISSRRKRPSLFLGPARFANHDCDSNAKLNTSGAHGIHIVARRTINIGEEVTVCYGQDYFGEDNQECLCKTCERLGRNGWDPRGPILVESSDEDEEEEEKPKRRRASSKSRRERAEAAASLKRKREEESHDPNQPPPKRRGRPPKRRYVRKIGPQPKREEDIGPEHGLVARDLMAEWFEKRCNGELDEEFPEETLAGLHAQFQIKQEPMEDELPAGVMKGLHGRLEKPHGLSRIIDVLADAAGRRAHDLGKMIQTVNEQIAALMGIEVADVPLHYGSAEKPKPIPSRVTKSAKRGVSRSRPASPPQPDDTASSGLSRKTSAEPEDAGAIISISEKSPGASPARQNTTDKPAHEKITGRFVQRKQLPSSAKKPRSESNLRNVVNADDTTASDLFEVPDSPAPQSLVPLEAPRRKRGRPRKHPRPEDCPPESGKPLLPEPQTQASTDSSSMSSIFSNESRQEEASSLSSLDHSPEPPTNFAKGRILENIVSLYTTESPDPSATEASELDTQDENPADERRGRLPTRKSLRRDPPPASPNPAMPSIEDPSQEAATAQDPDNEDEPKRGPPRTPLDYHLTPLLLATILHRWVECRNCDEYFVQAEAYQTRIACPRCERHSKLYGYHWPKTEKDGRFDEEERVTDHRTIHRFIEPEEERAERKGRKHGLEELRESHRASSSEARGDSESVAPLRREGSGRVTRSRA